MSTNKQYIGTGKDTKFEGSIVVSINMKDAEKFLRTSDSGQWLNFIVSRRKSPSEKGSTHSAFILTGNNEQEETSVVSEPAPEAPKKDRKLKPITKEEAAMLRQEQARKA